MKHLFTNKLFALFLLTLSLFSCQDKEKEAAEAMPVDPAGCRVATEETQYSTERKVIEHEYDSQGYITRQVETYIKNGSSRVREITSFEYNASKQLIKKTTAIGSEIQHYFVYEYNDSGTVSKITMFDRHGGVNYANTYTYDANKRLIGMHVVGYLREEDHRYEYDSNGNITKDVMYVFGNMFSPSRVATYENYDDKFNPVYAIKGLVLTTEGKHNPGKITVMYGSNMGSVSTFTYSYNASGYATEIQETYNGNQLNKDVYTYNGCR